MKLASLVALAVVIVGCPTWPRFAAAQAPVPATTAVYQSADEGPVAATPVRWYRPYYGGYYGYRPYYPYRAYYGGYGYRPYVSGYYGYGYPYYSAYAYPYSYRYPGYRAYYGYRYPYSAYYGYGPRRYR
jgi:hypothetical protein